jgi:hypothetical protein
MRISGVVGRVLYRDFGVRTLFVHSLKSRFLNEVSTIAVPGGWWLVVRSAAEPEPAGALTPRARDASAPRNIKILSL